MNKKMKIIILISIIGIILNINFASGAFSLVVGTTYDFEVVKSKWSLTDGANSGTGTGLMFGGNPFPVGTTFETEVVSVITLSVDYQIDVDGNTAVNTDDDSDTSHLYNFLFYPYLLYGGIGGWDQAEVEMGPPFLFELFFLEPAAFGAYFQNLEDHYATLTLNPFWTINQISANYDTTSSSVVFDWVFNTMLNDTGCDQFFQGTYYVKIAFSTATGELLGYRLQMDYAGHYGANDVNFEMEQLIKQTNYELDGFYYSAEEVPGFQWVTVLPVLFITSLITIVKKKQRKY
ncbi:MAG: choice-of-anchor S family protein [Candidatus Heimdallarchaeota archaeon]